MESGRICKLTEDEYFYFDCHCQVPCFNECCRDLNQFLTPYDILRLKNHLGMASYEFLSKYTTRHIGPQTGLPVVTLTPADRFERICPFVTASGCSVYENRPSSCRMYPVMRILSRGRKDGKKTIRYALLTENHCHGFEQPRQLTVREWMSRQGLGPYNAYNDLMIDIISLKNQYHSGPLEDPAQRLFYAMSYDIDGIRETDILSELEDVEIADDINNYINKDDETLLRFTMNYLTQFFAG